MDYITARNNLIHWPILLYKTGAFCNRYYGHKTLAIMSSSSSFSELQWVQKQICYSLSPLVFNKRLSRDQRGGLTRHVTHMSTLWKTPAASELLLLSFSWSSYVWILFFTIAFHMISLDCFFGEKRRRAVCLTTFQPQTVALSKCLILSLNIFFMMGSVCKLCWALTLFRVVRPLCSRSLCGLWSSTFDPHLKLLWSADKCAILGQLGGKSAVFFHLLNLQNFHSDPPVALYELALCLRVCVCLSVWVRVSGSALWSEWWMELSLQPPGHGGGLPYHQWNCDRKLLSHRVCVRWSEWEINANWGWWTEAGFSSCVMHTNAHRKKRHTYRKKERGSCSCDWSQSRGWEWWQQT